jgi:hypothetical protein
MHIKFGKESYTTSSRRHATKLEDMIRGLQCTRLASTLGKRTRNEDIASDDDVTDDDVVTHRANASIYHSPNAVIYEGSSINASIQELVLIGGGLHVKEPVSRSRLKLLSPNMKLELLWSAIKRCDNPDVRAFCLLFGTQTGTLK